MSKDYLFKDVLFGLRPEYLKVEEQLKELKKHSIVLDKNIEDFKYFIFKWNKDMKPELGCKFKRKENKVQEKFRIFTSSLGYIKNRGTILVRDNNNNYNMREANFPIMLDNGSGEYIHELIQNILNSDFANYMCMPYIRKEINSNEYIFKITPSYIDLDIQNDLMKNILFFSPEDILSFCCYNPILGRQLLQYVFTELKLSSDILNEYQQDIISKNNPFNKEVYIPEFITQKEQYIIEECSKEYVLKNIK